MKRMMDFSNKEFWKGFGFALLGHLGYVLVVVGLLVSCLGSCGPYGPRADIAGVLVAGFGFFQWVYLGPWTFLAIRKGNNTFAGGLLAVGGLTLLAYAGSLVYELVTP